MWFAKKKCKACKKKLRKNDETADLRLETGEGVHTMEICLECAEFFDKSAEVLVRRKKDEEIDDE